MYFNINQVAKIIDVVPATIRNWEKKGLFIPKRAKNNYRIFDFQDIELLKKIKTYSSNENIGMEGIKNILDNGLRNDTMGNSHPQNTRYSREFISKKWKQAREQLNYTLEEVSRQTGISISYLSKIENCQANISIDILNKLAELYGESILYFFEQEDTENLLVQANKRKKISTGQNGVEMESLIAIKKFTMNPIMFTIQPGCGSEKNHKHHGEEFIYVMSGKLEVVLNNKDIYKLKTGDSIYFNSYTEHSWNNPGKKPVKLLWVHSHIES